MASPSSNFDYIVEVSPVSPGVYQTTASSIRDPITIQDYEDGGSNSDNLTQLGDIVNDHYNVNSRSQSTSTTGIYNAETLSGSGFVGHAQGPNFQYYFLYTNINNYPSGVTVETISSPFSLACYVTGTQIRCRHGDIAVENLRVGDLAVTASGAHRAICWIGSRTLRGDFSGRSIIAPVRIAAHAFGPDKPIRDLYVSPAHAICIDILGEFFVPALALVNGSTIKQIDMATITYWHVEFDTHDVLIAENLPAESYLEMENRAAFVAQGSSVICGDPTTSERTHRDFCRPYFESGPLVDTVRVRLQTRAARLSPSEPKFFNAGSVGTLERPGPVAILATSHHDHSAEHRPDFQSLSPEMASA